MAREYARSDRVADQIQRELARLIQRDMSDPRLELLSVSAVEVTRDLAYATVYVSSLTEKTSHKEILSVLAKANGFLRRELGKAMRLRIVPELKFKYDESIEKGMSMAKLIDDAVKNDSNDSSEED
ncbi:MAG: 30S ribosome-binding factor RbfA [Sulfuriflexus sp.]|nr:30S ribosome-binding factor RbfA [Sulfuriflexus sp.]